MSVRGPVPPVELSHFNLRKEREEKAANERKMEEQKRHDEKLAREKKALEELRKAFKQRVAGSQLSFANNAPPHVKQQIGGTAGEFIRLAKLQPESLAGVVMVQLTFFLLSLLINKEWHVYNRMYKEACDKGYGYDGTQDIYELNEKGEPDFSKPYPKGATIPNEVIVRNGYMLPRDWFECWGVECIKFVEQQAGHQVIPLNYLELAYGPKEAAALKKSQSGGGDHTAEDLASQSAMRGPRPITPIRRPGGQ